MLSRYLAITARQPVGLAVLTQLQAGLNAVLRLALQQLYFVLLQRLRNSVPERRQAHGVLMPPGLHKRQVRVVQVTLRVQGPGIGIADKQPGRGCQRHQVEQRIPNQCSGCGMVLAPQR